MGERKSTDKLHRIGILGGSFDPVHIGHVNLARDALTQASLDQVLLIPARLQPFKQDRTPASGEDRMEMLRLALAEDPQIEPCAYELEHEGVSYTYLTLRGMQEKFGPETKLYFIIGTDSLLKLETWMESRELLTQYSYIVGSRPGYLDDELERCMNDLRERYGTEIIRIHNQRFDISATEIREALAEGKSVSGWISAPVEEYIREHGLYQPLQKSKLEEWNRQGMAYIRKSLKQSRFDHTMRVREEAIRLAERFGADSAKAETAAIFHDMAKNLTADEMNALVRKFGLDERYLDNPNLAHSKLAACMMERDFGITDPDILNAVASHTTGRPSMSCLEKVVFLADAIEPERSYPSVREIRRLAETDLDQACIRMLERTILHLKNKGAVIDPDTANALQDLQNKQKMNS